MQQSGEPRRGGTQKSRMCRPSGARSFSHLTQASRPGLTHFAPPALRRCLTRTWPPNKSMPTRKHSAWLKKRKEEKQVRFSSFLVVRLNRLEQSKIHFQRHGYANGLTVPLARLEQPGANFVECFLIQAHPQTANYFEVTRAAVGADNR